MNCKRLVESLQDPFTLPGRVLGVTEAMDVNHVRLQMKELNAGVQAEARSPQAVGERGVQVARQFAVVRSQHDDIALVASGVRPRGQRPRQRGQLGVISSCWEWRNGMSFTLLRLPQAWRWGGLSFKELAVRTYAAVDRHETLDRAAIVAFYAMLALVPFLGLVLTITLGTSDGVVAGQILSLSRQFLPGAADEIVRGEMLAIQAGPRVGVMSVSFLILLWSASSASVAVMEATNAAYGVRDSRPWWRRRLMAVVLTVVESFLLVGASFLITAWPWLLGWFGLESMAAAAATAVQWLVVVVALLASFAIAYYFGTHVDQEWEWISPGSAIGVLVLIAVNLGFRVYLRYAADFGATYGLLAGVILLLLWLYLAALALLVGVEINCVIAHAASRGKFLGQKVAPRNE